MLAHHRFGLLVAALSLAGCLFDEKPCFETSQCGLDQVCIDRDCVPLGNRADRPPEPPTDGADPDVPVLDAEAETDGGPAADARVEPDACVGLDCDPCEGAPMEVCNGRDDDCDEIVDEGAPQCDVPPNCTWQHRATHTYLFCDGAAQRSEASVLCTETLPLMMAVPEDCDETEWLLNTGNVVPSAVDWVGDPRARGRAWWLGLMLEIPDDAGSLIRTDSLGVQLDPCWMGGEPDDAALGETCVELRYNRVADEWGWNDELCEVDRVQNPINILCEVPCDPFVDRDGDGENACLDCDDSDPETNADNPDGCPLPPEAGQPPL